MLKKLRNKKGFTLAELLIVVAIIGVLVAISIPIFTSQLEKARRATNQANARAAYAAASAEYLEDDTVKGGTYDVEKGTFTVNNNTTDAAAKDYGASATGAIKQFNVTISANGVKVTPQDNGTNASYNKDGSSTGSGSGTGH